MNFKPLFVLFISNLCIVNVLGLASNDRWDSTTEFSESTFIASGSTISIDAGTTIKIPKEIDIVFSGSLEVVGEGIVTF